MTATQAQWKARQERLNAFTNRYVKGVGALKADGHPGPATIQRIKDAKFWLGWNQRQASWTDNFAAALRNPRSSEPSSTATVRRGIQRRSAHNLAWAKTYFKRGVTTFDGVRVAKAAVPYLVYARDNGWPGHLVSGYRDPAYSEKLCYQICGHPSCPGRCAGRTSNHTKAGPAIWAIDVSDYVKFGQVVAHAPYHPRIFNDLPIDPVHYSPTGH